MHYNTITARDTFLNSETSLRWLYAVLHHIHRVTYFFNQEKQSSHQKTCERMALVEKRIQKIEEQEQDVRKNMAARLAYQTEFLDAKLNEYIHSTEFKTKLCTWIKCSFPPIGETWVTTKSNVKKGIDYRFKELLIQWENDNQVYAEIHRQLVDEFRTRFDTLGGLYILEVHACIEKVSPPKKCQIKFFFCSCRRWNDA